MPTRQLHTHRLRRLAGVMVGVLVVQVLAVFCFLMTQTRLRPRDLPVGLVAPAPAVATLEQRLEAARDGALAVTAYPSVAAARAAVLDRTVYGALAVAPTGAITVLTASAASPAAAQLLGEVGSAVAAGQRAPVTVEDLRPIDADDPRGAALQAVLFPLVLTSVAAGIVLVGFGIGAARAARLTLLAGFAVIAGLTGAAAVAWLGVLPGAGWAEAGILALTAFAVAASVGGVGAVLRGPGLGFAALTMVLVGILGAGAAAPRELLPQFWRLLGGYLPPGAGADALRNVAYFDAAATAAPLAILATYAVAGAVLLTLPRTSRPAASVHAQGSEPDLTVAP